MDTKLNRETVYKMIDKERDYQSFRWNENTTTSNGNHCLEAWFMYIEDYVNEAKNILTRIPSPKAEQMASEIMRKVAALGVAAMENCGAPERDDWHE